MKTDHALNLEWCSLCLLCASVGFFGGVLKSSYDREQERMRTDTRSIDQRVHDIAAKMGEERRKNAGRKTEWQRVVVEPETSDHNGTTEGFLKFTFYGDGQGSQVVYLGEQNTVTLEQQINESLKWLERVERE